MLYLQFANGWSERRPEAITAAYEGDELVCRGLFGEIVIRYAKHDVAAFGMQDAFSTQVTATEGTSGPGGSQDSAIGQPIPRTPDSFSP